jgi:mRNA-degrading endonuclease toxin of MazEF toxin-antitoxin module
MTLRPGDIYLCHDERGEHRVLIVSAEKFNRGSHAHTVLFTTKKLHLKVEPNYVFFAAGEPGIEQDCVMQAESLERTPCRYLDFQRGLLGRVPDEKMGEVIAAIGYVLGAACYLTDE